MRARGRIVAVLAHLVGGALILAGSVLVWATVVPADAPSVELDGTTVAPALAPVALTLGALGLALTLASPIVARVLAVLGVAVVGIGATHLAQRVTTLDVTIADAASAATGVTTLDAASTTTAASKRIESGSMATLYGDIVHTGASTPSRLGARWASDCGETYPLRSASRMASASCLKSSTATRQASAREAASSAPFAPACASSTRRKSASSRSITLVFALSSASFVCSMRSSADCHQASSSSAATSSAGTCRAERSSSSGSRCAERIRSTIAVRSWMFCSTSDSRARSEMRLARRPRDWFLSRSASVAVPSTRSRASRSW